jgi:hypothetical protein
LYGGVNKPLKSAMHLALLAIALSARVSPPPAVRAERVATASVQILVAEIIDFEKPAPAPTPQIKTVVDRQHRARGGMPMVEFY